MSLISLYVEANEPSLYNRRIKLGLQYATKLKSYPNNPAYDCVFNPLYIDKFDKSPNRIPTFGIRIRQHILDSGIELGEITNTAIPSSPPWLYPEPKLIFYLREHKKSLTNPLIIQHHFAEIKSKYSDYYFIYTDGSKDGDRVGCAAVAGQRVASLRLPSSSSIFTAEARAIVLAMKFLSSSKTKKAVICSDSLSCLQAIKKFNNRNPVILEIIELHRKLVRRGMDIYFLWIPSHIGIFG